MAVSNASNFSGANQFEKADAASDPFERGHLQTLAAAVDAHTHASGLGAAVKRIDSGAFASRPAAGNAGHVYFATDTGQLFADDGTAWDEIAAVGVAHTWTGLQTFNGGIALPAGDIQTSEIADLAIATAKIAEKAVTTAKIADLAIGAAQIGLGAITTDQIQNGTLADIDISTTAAIAQSKISNAARAIDADMVDGQHAAAFATAGHTHDATYVNEGQGNAIATAMVQDGAITSRKWLPTVASDLAANIASHTGTVGEVVLETTITLDVTSRLHFDYGIRFGGVSFGADPNRNLLTMVSVSPYASSDQNCYFEEVPSTNDNSWRGNGWSQVNYAAGTYTVRLYIQWRVAGHTVGSIVNDARGTWLNVVAAAA